MATQNSIESYMEMVLSEELGEKQRVVYDYIKNNPDCSYNDIARALKQHHNTVTARIKELRDAGYVITSGSKRDEYTGKNNNVYRIRLRGEIPDDMSKNARPKIPKSVVDELQSMLSEEYLCPMGYSTKSGGVRWEIQRDKSGIRLSYGDFLKLRNIVRVCSMVEQNAVYITGTNFTVIFRLN